MGTMPHARKMPWRRHDHCAVQRTAAATSDGLSQIDATVCRMLQIPQNRRGLLAERREGADQPEQHRDGSSARRRRSGRRAGQPRERQVHDFGHDDPGGDRAGRHAEQRGREPRAAGIRARRRRSAGSALRRASSARPHRRRGGGGRRRARRRAPAPLRPASTALAPRIASTRLRTISPTASSASLTRTVVTAGKRLAHRLEQRDFLGDRAAARIGQGRDMGVRRAA